MDCTSGELEKRFRAEARLRADAVTALVEDLADGTDPAATCGGIREHAHKLKGAAGIFGFDELRLRASELEEAAALHAVRYDEARAVPELSALSAGVTGALPE